MKPTASASLLATAATFGAAAWLLVGYAPWANHTDEGIAWLCTALAVSITLLVLLCQLADAAPAQLPVRFCVLSLTAVTVLFVAASTLVTDASDWLDDPAERAGWLPHMAAEWAGFCMVFATVLFLPRAAHRAGASRPLARVADPD